MKFQPDTPQSLNVIEQISADGVMISKVRYMSSVLVPSDSPVQAWPVKSIDTLTAEHMSMILTFNPELIVLGTGAQMRFVHPGVLQALMTARIGVETMTTAAACRTYNVLASEGRRVVAALLI